jgi:hypothetical protein
MPRRWKPPKEERMDLDKIRLKQVLAKKLNDAVAYGSEEDSLKR